MFFGEIVKEQYCKQAVVTETFLKSTDHPQKNLNLPKLFKLTEFFPSFNHQFSLQNTHQFCFCQHLHIPF